MKMLKTLGLTLAMAGLLAAPALATEISGTITFAGTVTLDTASAGSATQVTGWYGFGGVGNPFVASVGGDFDTYINPGDAATLTSPWFFNSGALPALWSVGGFTFDLVSSAITNQNATGVTVDGYGYASGNGFSASLGSWHFTTQDPSAGGVFSFSAATGVPDGGSTLILLGSAILGLAVVIRRRLA
jgi:hypothetical protein